MKYVIDLYYRAMHLCLFRMSPVEMPAGQTMMRWSVLIYVLIGMMTAQVQVSGWVGIMIFSTVEAVLFLVFIYGLLMMRGKGERITKTITAIMSTSTVIGVVGLPLLAQLPEDLTAGVGTGLSFLLLVFVLWNLMVMAHIFRHAMDIKPGMAAVVSVVVLVLMMVVDGLLVATLT